MEIVNRVLTFLSFSTLLDTCKCVEVVEFFSGPYQCNWTDSNYGCFESRHGRLNCFSDCLKDETCFGVSVEPNGQSCWIHKDCKTPTPCDGKGGVRRYFARNCAHGGRWKRSSDKCQCVNGWVGDKCQHLPKDPMELLEAGYRRQERLGYMNLSLNKNTKVMALVMGVAGKKTQSKIVILTNSGNKNYNMTLKDYSDGFYNNPTTFWVGFETLVALNQAGYKSLRLFLSLEGVSKLSSLYYGFHISDASGKYRFTFHSRSSESYGNNVAGLTLRDCLGDYKNVPFSTFDNDEDGDTTKNCASTIGLGWWYRGCQNNIKCNIFGWGSSYDENTPDGQKIFAEGIPPEYFSSRYSPTFVIVLRKDEA